jgi:hypothetical protein
LPCIARKGKIKAAGAPPAGEGDMKYIRGVVIAAAAVLALGDAQAATLKVVTVAAPAINCVFDASCKVVVTDNVGNLTFTPLGAGARLQSRTFAAKAGTPGAGTTAYLYRVDLTQGAGFTECTVGLVVNFGPVTKLPYVANTPADVFVVTQGGLGTVGVKSAEQDGDVITFTFDKYLCAGQTSFFFGMAAAKAPMTNAATLYGFGNPPFVQATARAPTH